MYTDVQQERIDNMDLETELIIGDDVMQFELMDFEFI